MSANPSFFPLYYAVSDNDPQRFKQLWSSTKVTDIVYENLMIHCAQMNRPQCIEAMLPAHNPSLCYSALKEAVRKGHDQCLEVLLFEQSLTKTFADELISQLLHDAIMGDYQACVKQLVMQIQKQPDQDKIKSKIEISVYQAADFGAVDCLKFLLSVATHTDNSEALCYAASGNYLDCVKMLLPSSNPKTNMSTALRWACYHENHDMLQLLYPVSDAQETLIYMKAHPDEDEEHAVAFLEQYVVAQKEHEEISQHITHNAPSVKRKI